MTWRDAYQPGSFRGAAFRTAGHERRGGRRVAVHEMPARDEPVVEDLGRRARSFTVECHVIGPEYRADRDALIDAIEDEGPGLLVHPWHGRMMVSVLDYSSEESTEDGGVCWFTIGFIEAGEPVPAPVAVADGRQAAAQADLITVTAPERFAARFTVEGAAGFVEDSAIRLIDDIAAAAQVAAGLRGGIGPTLRAFEVGLRFLPGNVANLLRAPLHLGQAVVGLVLAISALGGGGGRQRRLAAYDTLLAMEPSDPAQPERTPQRRLEGDNRRALLQLLRSSVAAELVREAAGVDYASYQDAVAAREAIGERLDALALAAADRGEDEEAAVFDRLRHALARDIAVRGETLARVYGLTLSATEPALVVAHRHYGNAPSAGIDRRAKTLEERTAGIVDRNRVRHPGFVPAGVELELLTVKGRAA